MFNFNIPSFMIAKINYIGKLLTLLSTTDHVYTLGFTVNCINLYKNMNNDVYI